MLAPDASLLKHNRGHESRPGAKPRVGAAERSRPCADFDAADPTTTVLASSLGLQSVAGLLRRAPRNGAGQSPWEERFMGIVGIIGTIIVGFVVGLLARFFYPGR